MLLDAFDARSTGDYGITVSFSPAEVKSALERTREFLDALKRYLERLEAKSSYPL